VGSCFYTPTTARDIVWHWQSQRGNNCSLRGGIDVGNDHMRPRSVLACDVRLLLFLTTLDHLKYSLLLDMSIQRLFIMCRIARPP